MFSQDTKDEIAAVRFERECCPGNFVRGLSAFSGAHGSRVLSTDRTAVARAALRAAKSAGLSLHVRTARGRRFGKGALEIGGDVTLANEPRAPSRACCRRAWLRGAFLACGSVADPRRAYHLEFFCRRDEQARALSEALATLGVDVGITRRRGRPLVYVKGATTVAELLGHLGAARAVLALDDLLALRYTKNATRRRVNSEAANAARAAATSARQRDAALRVVRRIGMDRLSAALREAARLRIAHPDYTLAELASRARPAVSKAAMAYRLREIERLAS